MSRSDISVKPKASISAASTDVGTYRVKMSSTELELKDLYEHKYADYHEKFAKEPEALNLWNQIIDQDFSIISPDFIQWCQSIDTKRGLFPISEKKLPLWLAVCTYLRSDDNKEVNIKAIEALLIKSTEKDGRPAGDGLLLGDIADGVIVRNVYMYGNEELVSLFTKLLPKPQASLFPPDRIPQYFIEEAEQAADTVVTKIIKNQHNIAKVEDAAMTLQRKFRSDKRTKEEKLLISAKQKYIKTQAAADQEIDRNTPYRPKCTNPGLADRLLKLSQGIVPFTTVKHIGAAKALPNILDDGFLGRKSLLRNYKPFRPAALVAYEDSNPETFGDLGNGDADAICFGASEIDPLCSKRNAIAVTLDLDKLRSLSSQAHNPCIFFKQRDLEFPLNRVRKLSIGAKEILFSHTNSFTPILTSPSNTYMQFYNGNRWHGYTMHHYSKLSNFQMISSNFKDMNAILAMNFFRFLDNTIDDQYQEDPNFITEIYEELDKLNDEDLEAALLQLTCQMCDTMEFNFYGSFLMKPELIKEISTFAQDHKEAYQLNVSELIVDLQTGNKTMLLEALEKIPQLFQSYRFIDHLLPHTQNPDMKEILLQHRGEIPLPLWRQRIESLYKPCASGEEVLQTSVLPNHPRGEDGGKLMGGGSAEVQATERVAEMPAARSFLSRSHRVVPAPSSAEGAAEDTGRF